MDRHHGFHRGIVKENKDPQNQRRVKVSVPQITGAEKTEWAWPMEPAHISVDVPVIGQGVWVTYLNGDPDYPVWSGTYGKNQGKNKRIFIKPLADSVSLTGLTTYIKTKKSTDGTTEVDLTDTLLLMANKLKTYETRIASLEAQLVTLHTTLGTRTAPNHTHGSNG
jgi:Type VI secretion system/phage-baseplate injector OB domain